MNQRRRGMRWFAMLVAGGAICSECGEADFRELTVHHAKHWRKLSSIAYLFKTEKKYRELIRFRNEFDDAIKQDNDELDRVELGVKVGTHLPMSVKMLE